MSIEPQKSFIIPGPAGQIEAILTTPAHSNEEVLGIVCHPHPVHGGTMRNKVVTTATKALDDTGIRALRFNYRGVGKSDGSYNEGKGETEDLLAVIEWAKENAPHSHLWLIGFSFGTCISAKAATMVDTDLLISIAPPVNHFDFSSVRPNIQAPWFIIQGEEDEVCSPNEVFAWHTKAEPQPTLYRFPKTGHFFHGKLIELRKQLVSIMRMILN